MITIAVDAMGGDSAPAPEVHGAVRAAETQAVKIILVGREELIRQELARFPQWRQLPIQVVHASEVVTMDGGEWLQGAGEFSVLGRQLTNAEWERMKPGKPGKNS